jgi:acetyl/propionyl-CoA carboxylase alpha subunit
VTTGQVEGEIALGKRNKVNIMSKNAETKTSLATRVGKLQVGLRKRYPTGSQKLTFRGAKIVVTVDDAIAKLQAVADNRAAVTAAKAEAAAKIEAENTALKDLLAFVRALVAFIRFTFGDDQTALDDFGVAPLKARTPMTTEQKAVAQVKRQATRQARGEVGAKKRKAIKGNVTAQLVVTPETPPAPAAPATPSTPNKA